MRGTFVSGGDTARLSAASEAKHGGIEESRD
jgi:hypothetical protein